MTTDDVVLDPQQVAELLKVSRKVVMTLARRGELRSVKVGRSRRFTPSEVQSYINRNSR